MSNLQLADVIDWDHVEQMLDQHGRYQFGRIVIQRRDRYKAGLRKSVWYVYVDGKEHTVRMCPDASSTAYGSLADALEVALSPANHELWGIA